MKKKRNNTKKGKKDYCTELNDAHDAFNKKIEKTREKYDINDSEHFIFFEKGNSLSPEMLEVIKAGTAFFKKILQEPTFSELSQQDYKEQCRFLEMQNRSLKLMNSVWLKIFEDIKNNPESIKRYYPMVRVKITNSTIHNFIRAYVENEDFYERSQTITL